QAVLAILNQVNDRLDGERAQLYTAQTHLEQINLRMAALQARIAELGTQTQGRRAVIDARARALYELGPVQDISAIAGSTSLDQLVGRAGALDSIATYDQRVLDDLTGISNETKADREDLAAQ